MNVLIMDHVGATQTFRKILAALAEHHQLDLTGIIANRNISRGDHSLLGRNILRVYSVGFPSMILSQADGLTLMGLNS